MKGVQVEVAQLRAFLAVAEELHFGRAAQRLHIGQPPLSRTIQQLERQLESRLFDRSTRTVNLTDAGRALVEPANTVLEALRRAEDAVAAAGRGESGTVRLAFAGVSTYRLVADWARLIKQRRPGIRLDLSSQNFAQPALRKLLDKDADVALGRWDVIPAGIVAKVALIDSLVLAIADTHPLSTRTSVSFAELAHEDFISLPAHEGAVLADRLRRLSHAAGFAANLVQVAPDTQSALALAGAEVGCHLTLSSVAENAQQPGLRFVPVSDETADVHLRLAWRANDSNPALWSVLKLVEELLPESPTDRERSTPSA